MSVHITKIFMMLMNALTIQKLAHSFVIKGGRNVRNIPLRSSPCTRIGWNIFQDQNIIASNANISKRSLHVQKLQNLELEIATIEDMEDVGKSTASTDWAAPASIDRGGSPYKFKHDACQ